MEIDSLYSFISEGVSKQGREFIGGTENFNLGYMDELLDMSDMGSGKYCAMPYDKCAFEIESRHYSCVVILLKDEGSINGLCFMRATGGVWLWPQVVMRLRVDDNQQVSSVEFMDTKTNKVYGKEDDFKNIGNIKAPMHIMLSVVKATEVLACSNVEFIDHPAPKFINRKRIKKGKLPLVSYKTLHIVIDKANRVSNPSGGTHASPRLHLRRGHIRRLPSGNRIWIQSCLVGDESQGVIKKDYAVTLH